jgi:hypothetical protein
MKDGYKAEAYNCGLPSNTPFAQAGIMYGKNDCIPGFAFVDKKLRKKIAVRSPLSMLFIEHAYFHDRPGILDGGNSYVNIFSGGAKKSRMVASVIFKKGAFFRQLDVLLFLLNPNVLGRTLLHGTIMGISTLGQTIYEAGASIITPFKAASDAKYDFTRLFSSVIIEELETGALVRDMKRGIPYLYMTYNGYDENSHHQGPTSPAAYEAIQDIDKKIEYIFKHKKDYDIFVLSDHGHTESVPFRSLYGMSFEKFVKQTLGKYKHELRPHFFERLRRKKSWLKAPLHPVASFEKVCNRFMAKNLSGVLSQMSWNSHPYFLEVSDCMANLYFNYSAEKIHLPEIEKKYPGLITTLKDHPGIGFVFGSDGEHVHVYSKYGSARIGKENNDHAFEGERFLKEYGNETTVLKQIRYLAQMYNSGDLVIFGDYSKHNVISFINHYGSHGSAGGEQMHPFFMTTHDQNLSQVTNVQDLYKIFMSYHEPSTTNQESLSNKEPQTTFADSHENRKL